MFPLLAWFLAVLFHGLTCSSRSCFAVVHRSTVFLLRTTARSLAARYAR